jgi:hypothetical protein
MPTSPTCLRQLLLHALAVLLLASLAGAQKTDKVLLGNGDSLTVEIKSLERGKLRVKTFGMGTIEIEAIQLARLQSDKVFRFEVASGLDWFGSLLDSGRDRELLVQREVGTVRLSLDRIVRMTPINDHFLERIDGSVNVGFNYAKATEITQFNLGFDIAYDARKYTVSLNGSSNLSRQPTLETKRRNELNGGYRYYWRPRWFLHGLGGLQQNDELGLKLRTYAIAGVGRRIAQTSYNSLSATVGLSVSEESATGASGSQGNVEGVLHLEYQVFRFDSPELDINATSALFPSFTTSGRLRSDTRLRLRWEFVKDFTWDLTFYSNTDSEPLNGQAATSDLGVISGVGFTF